MSRLDGGDDLVDAIESAGVGALFKLPSAVVLGHWPPWQQRLRRTWRGIMTVPLRALESQGIPAYKAAVFVMMHNPEVREFPAV